MWQKVQYYFAKKAKKRLRKKIDHLFSDPINGIGIGFCDGIELYTVSLMALRPLSDEEKSAIPSRSLWFKVNIRVVGEIRLL